MGRERIMYIENKSGENDLIGDARIGRVTFSKTGKSILDVKRMERTDFMERDFQFILTKTYEKNIGLKSEVSQKKNI